MSTLRFVYTLPAATADVLSEIEDTFVAELWQRGTLGLELRPGALPGRSTVDAYFPAPAVPGDAGALAEPGNRLRALGVELERIEDVPAEDWLAAWRAAARPFPVGRRFLLDPREPESAPAAGAAAAPAEDAGPRLRLRLPARGAFGTGSHESTRLALELLEELPLAGRSLLDVGTGTGVLAFAALALGAGWAAGCDVDPVAAFHAVENRTLNRSLLRSLPPPPDRPAPVRRAGPALWAGGLAALAPAARFDVVVANLLPERILAELPRLTAAVAAQGCLVYSGMLAASASEMLGRFAGHRLHERRRRTAGEWAAVELVRG